MRWRKKDLEQYVQAKEYIDTIIIPLIPFQMNTDNDLRKDSFQNEALNLFVSELEKELSGRVLLIPNYYYTKDSDAESEIKRLNEWVDNIKTQPFEHVFFISFDTKWKKIERELNGSLVWLSGFQSGNLQSKELTQLMREQVKDICDLIRSFW